MAAEIEVLIKTAGLLGFGLGVLNLVRSLIERSQDRRRRIEDEFWLQKVIYPQAIQPLMTALEGLGSWCAKTSEPPSLDACVNAWTKLQEELVLADSRMRILAVLGEDLYDRLGDIRHKADDAMAELVQTCEAAAANDGDMVPEHMTLSQLQSLVGELMREVVQSVIDAQRKL